MKTADIALLLAIGLATATPAAGQKPHFEGTVVAQWLENPDGPDREMLLLAPFAFVDADGTRWDVPEGTKVNGASIPQILWGPFGSPFVGDYRNASVVHDYYCLAQTRPPADVHRMFYRALRTSGVSKITAKLFYAAVYYLGLDWTHLNSMAITAMRPEEDVERLWDSIRENDLTLDEIDLFFSQPQSPR